MVHVPLQATPEPMAVELSEYLALSLVNSCSAHNCTKFVLAIHFSSQQLEICQGHTFQLTIARKLSWPYISAHNGSKFVLAILFSSQRHEIYPGYTVQLTTDRNLSWPYISVHNGTNFVLAIQFSTQRLEICPGRSFQLTTARILSLPYISAIHCTKFVLAIKFEIQTFVGILKSRTWTKDIFCCPEQRKLHSLFVFR